MKEVLTSEWQKNVRCIAREAVLALEEAKTFPSTEAAVPEKKKNPLPEMRSKLLCFLLKKKKTTYPNSA